MLFVSHKPGISFFTYNWLKSSRSKIHVERYFYWKRCKLWPAKIFFLICDRWFEKLPPSLFVSTPEQDPNLPRFNLSQLEGTWILTAFCPTISAPNPGETAFHVFAIEEISPSGKFFGWKQGRWFMKIGMCVVEREVTQTPAKFYCLPAPIHGGFTIQTTDGCVIFTCRKWKGSYCNYKHNVCKCQCNEWAKYLLFCQYEDWSSWPTAVQRE